MLRISLIVLTLSNILLLAVSDHGTLQNRLSFSLENRLIFSSGKEHVLATGKNAANISTNDSIFHIHFRYSIHDYRLVIMDSNDNHELYKVMCNLYLDCRILQDGMELIRVNRTIKESSSSDMPVNGQSIDIGNNWTILRLTDESKVMLFHAAYSSQQPLAEFFPFAIFDLSSRNPNYTLTIVQQSLFEPAFLLAMGILIDGL